MTRRLTAHELKKLEFKARGFRYLADAENWLQLRKRDEAKFDALISGPQRIALALYVERKKAARALGYYVGPDRERSTE